MSKPLMLFNPKLPLLSKEETQVLELMVEASKMIASLYELQENHEFSGANFYPKNATKEEIEKAAKKDPEILSPYTVVERVNGKLAAIPYHIKYADYLKPIADKLIEASKITINKDFAKSLALQAKALLDGSYEKADISWMKMKPYILDIVIGPIERYDDRLFFTKTSYQAWVGIMDESASKRADQYKQIILNARRQSLTSTEKVDFYDKVQVRVDDVAVFSGLIARTVFLGVNLPNDPNLMEKYGSEIFIFKQANEYRFKHEVLPAFNTLFSKSFKKLFTPQDIEQGTLSFTILHELGHTYLRYRDAEKRLQDFFPVIDELAAYVMGIRLCGHLLLKDVVTSKQLESTMVAFMARSFELVLYEKDNKSKYHYTLGGAIFINYLLENGAIQQSGGVSWPNFTKMFFSLGEFASMLERILASGNRKDAENLIVKYGDMEKLQRFK